jgi:hypothetical protein
MSAQQTSIRLVATIAVAVAVLLVHGEARPVSAQQPQAPMAHGAENKLGQVSVRTQRRIRDEPKARARVRVDGSYEGLAGIELRGQSSQTFAKKSYSLELRHSDGSDRRAGLLGMPADGDWILHGPWIDKTAAINRRSPATGDCRASRERMLWGTSR